MVLIISYFSGPKAKRKNKDRRRVDYYEDAAASSSHGMNEVSVGVRGNRYNDMAPKYVISY